MNRSSALRAAAAALTVSSALFLAGCAKSVVGKWQYSAPLPTGGTIPITTEFKSDGTVQGNGQLNVPMAGNVNVVANGTYKVEGSNISTQFQDVKLNDKSMPQLRNQLNINGTFKVNGDSLEITSGDKTTTLTRVKE